ncbi:HPr family phosphocarrier protein [Parvularcula flava]|uniref:HPr family phosphocarrier protein n=1 Tax=Aquisalinus luteolus TaxID=1566827 RepID=A0A8J3ERC4_9PROT|nr:HPr family phosphocarrier protein [Aquisalinus luteolus]NHK28541.1 HPr family phosphocarrier protein [Aquisalinus luteolus]GGH98787.1 HPr kinase [Aquisalinus luteolus]
MSDTQESDGVVSQKVTIINRRGLHARASAKFCAVAGSFEADIRVIRDGFTVGACSIMGLLTLGAGENSVIELTATGPQAMEAVDTLVKLVEDRFGEGE